MGAMIRHGRIGLYPPVGYKLRGGRPGNGYAWRCLASASRVTRLNDDIKYVAHPVSNAKSPLRLTLCAGVCRPPNRSAPDSARSHLRIDMRPPTSWSRPFQVFKSEANSWSCRQPGPLVTHAPSLTWEGVSLGIPTGMPDTSESRLRSFAFGVSAALGHFIRPVPCKGR
ncbi:hypothetical protein BO79DRAFT_227838 [Aspergillus costaricaensis CBS 115574]|uniref:Uncharacterized protein n=1 Tax=Aspergillus costaricaensis CBS 115574 TaxID=1448317 RepID=A0ACD1IH23_9EURO|nr:hypothetical protein BO79DRAFT_227838 [Aspergillus costaricaensis CBS 115574]RAK89636.1 hypothetical protein BO79DRAFT_227838 [Aspergillus costaricaensis CBS 115574]